MVFVDEVEGTVGVHVIEPSAFLARFASFPGGALVKIVDQLRQCVATFGGVGTGTELFVGV